MRAWPLFVVCALLQLLPLWSVRYLPMADLPQHAAQVATWIALGRPNYPFARLFTLNWLTPYLFGYAVTRLFALLFSIPTAMKLAVSLALAALPLTVARLLRRTGGDPRWAIMMVPFGFTMTFYWGFLNFLVATPVAVLFLTSAWEYAERPSRSGGARLGLFACFLLTCHVLILAFSCLIAAIMIRSARRSWRRLWPLAVPWPLAALWFARTLGREPAQSQAGGLHWQWSLFAQRFIQFPTEILGLSGGFDRSQCLCALGLCALPFLMGARIRWSRLWPAAAAAAVFFTLPFMAFGTSLLYPRFSVFVIPLALTGLEASPRPRMPRLGLALGLTLVMTSMLALTLRFRAFDGEARDFDAVMSGMDPGRTALSLIFLPGSSAIAAPVYLHFPMWYQATRGGTVEPSFADGYPQLVRHRPQFLSRSTAWSWSPQRFRWDEDGDYDYFVVRSRADVGAKVFAGDPVSLMGNRGLWWLYQRRRG